MNILIAPNAFKNSLDAAGTAEAIAEGFRQSALSCHCTTFPVGDGGDGTGELIIRHCGGEEVEVDTTDPLSRNLTASIGLINEGETAIIEMANASGIRLLHAHELDPLRATSYGTGVQIKEALSRGVKKIVVGMGGSATVDGGCGLLAALGVRFLDKDGNDLTHLPGTLVSLHAIDTRGMDTRIAGIELVVLCDVENRLLGVEGAAAVFGPQKGASPDEVQTLDRSLARLAAVVANHTGKDMAAISRGGTAGGAAAGLYAVCGAKLVNGIDYFLALTGFGAFLEMADIVVTGEGCIDEQTLSGKGPFGVAAKAKEKGLPVIGLAGKVPADPSAGLQQYFDVLLAIGNEPSALPAALANTAGNLTRTAKALGNLLALRQGRKGAEFSNASIDRKPRK